MVNDGFINDRCDLCGSWTTLREDRRESSPPSTFSTEDAGRSMGVRVNLPTLRLLSGAKAGEKGRITNELPVRRHPADLTNWHLYRHYVRPRMKETGAPTALVIDEFKRVRPAARPHSTVVFLNDPFKDWDMAFIAELWFHDRSITIRLQRKTPLSPADLARADYIFDWRGDRLLHIR